MPIIVALVVAKVGSMFKATVSFLGLSNVASAEFAKLSTACDRLAKVELCNRSTAYLYT